jgi:hypothetical protein
VDAIVASFVAYPHVIPSGNRRQSFLYRGFHQRNVLPYPQTYYPMGYLEG